VAAFEAFCGIGVTVTPEQIQEAVKTVFESNKANILGMLEPRGGRLSKKRFEHATEDRYHTNVGALIGKVRELQKWSDVKAVKEEIEKQLEALLGPKTAADAEPKKKDKTKAKAKAETVDAGTAESSEAPAASSAASSKFY